MKTYYIHRLVAEAFIPNPQNKLTVNHIDGNKQNNNINNLEWLSYKGNIIHAIKNGLNNHEGLKVKINQYSINGNFIKEWKSIHDITMQLGINNGNITSCCKNRRRTAGGYIWEYAN